MGSLGGKTKNKKKRKEEKGRSNIFSDDGVHSQPPMSPRRSSSAICELVCYCLAGWLDPPQPPRTLRSWDEHCSGEGRKTIATFTYFSPSSAFFVSLVARRASAFATGGQDERSPVWHTNERHSGDRPYRGMPVNVVDPRLLNEWRSSSPLPQRRYLTTP